MMWSLNDYLVQKFKELKFDCDDNSNLNDKLNQKVLKLDKENREWQAVNEKIILEHQEAVVKYQAQIQELERQCELNKKGLDSSKKNLELVGDKLQLDLKK